MKKSELAAVIREEFLVLEGNFDELKKHQKMLNNAQTFFNSKADELKVDSKFIMDFNKGINFLIDAVFKAENERGTMEEATYEVSPEDVDKIKDKVGDEDVVKVAEEMDDDEMDKAAAKGAKGKDAKGVAAQATAALKAQEKKKALKAFMDKMKDAGVVSDSNKVLDAGKYKDEFAKFKASL